MSPFYALDGRLEQLRFLEHWLKDVDTGITREPPVKLAIRRSRDDHVWRYEHEWPLARTEWTRLHLDASGEPTLRPEPPGSAGMASYQASPDVTGDGAALRFATAPVESEREITGPLALHVWVSASSPDADLFVVVRNVGPDGEEVTYQGAIPTAHHVAAAYGWLRLSHGARHRGLDPVAAGAHPHRSGAGDAGRAGGGRRRDLAHQRGAGARAPAGAGDPCPRRSGGSPRSTTPIRATAAGAAPWASTLAPGTSRTSWCRSYPRPDSGCRCGIGCSASLPAASPAGSSGWWRLSAPGHLDGPVIVAASHLSGFVDPVLLVNAVRDPAPVPGQGHAVAGAAGPAVPRGARLIPVHRAQDGTGTAANTAAFASAVDALAQDATVAIFPEGTTHDQPHLARLRTGVARIALQALDPGVTGLRILPAGIAYEDKVALRGRALVAFAPAIDVAAEVAGLRAEGHDEHGVVRGLLAVIEARLRSVSPDFPSLVDALALTGAARVSLRAEAE